jgi:hypothetical protein
MAADDNGITLVLPPTMLPVLLLVTPELSLAVEPS